MALKITDFGVSEVALEKPVVWLDHSRCSK